MFFCQFYVIDLSSVLVCYRSQVHWPCDTNIKLKLCVIFFGVTTLTRLTHDFFKTNKIKTFPNKTLSKRLWGSMHSGILWSLLEKKCVGTKAIQGKKKKKKKCWPAQFLILRAELIMKDSYSSHSSFLQEKYPCPTPICTNKARQCYRVTIPNNQKQRDSSLVWHTQWMCFCPDSKIRNPAQVASFSKYKYRQYKAMNIQDAKWFTLTTSFQSDHEVNSYKAMLYHQRSTLTNWEWQPRPNTFIAITWITSCINLVSCHFFRYWYPY